MAEKTDDVIRAIRIPFKVWDECKKRAIQNDRTPAAEARIALEIGLQGNVKIPLMGKINGNEKKGKIR